MHNRAWLLALIVLCPSCRHASRMAPVRAAAAQSDWVDLTPQMELRIESAYYRDGVPKQGLEGYLGTETAHVQVRSRGLRLLSIDHVLKPHPREQAPVERMIPASQ